MATKYYGIKDNWTDDDVANVIEVASEDGSVSSVKVNGVEYGGGGCDTVQVTIINNTGDEVELSGLVSLTSDPSGYYYTGPTYVPSGTETYTVPTYEGNTHMPSFGLNVTSVSGSATISGMAIMITGDCTITLGA